jgi:DNA polymerase-3 subunit chi
MSEGDRRPEILFYHLMSRPLDSVLPELLERSLARGWRVVVRGGVTERLAALNDHLWKYRDDAFLPHGDASDGHAARQPVYLTGGPEKPNQPDILMAIDRAKIAPAEFTAHSRLVVLFDGHDAEAVAEARDLWRQAAASACHAQYWAQDEEGRWVKRAENKP